MPSERDHPARVVLTAIDPKWRLLSLVLGEDGPKLLVLRLEHPEHGMIDSVLSDQSARDLFYSLGEVLGLDHT